MPLKHGILGLLNYRPMTGYDINRIFQTGIAFFWHAQTSQIYKELTTLMKNKWVESETIVQNDKPNKKLFHITEEGRLELGRWLKDADLSEIMKYKNPMLVKIFFSSQVNVDMTMRLLEKYIQECKAVIERMNQDLPMLSEFETKIQKDHESFYWGMTMTYGFMYYQNEIKWANWCIEKLKETI